MFAVAFCLLFSVDAVSVSLQNPRWIDDTWSTRDSTETDNQVGYSTSKKGQLSDVQQTNVSSWGDRDHKSGRTSDGSTEISGEGKKDDWDTGAWTSTEKYSNRMGGKVIVNASAEANTRKAVHEDWAFTNETGKLTWNKVNGSGARDTYESNTTFQNQGRRQNGHTKQRSESQLSVESVHDKEKQETNKRLADYTGSSADDIPAGHTKYTKITADSVRAYKTKAGQLDSAYVHYFNRTLPLRTSSDDGDYYTTVQSVSPAVASGKSGLEKISATSNLADKYGTNRPRGDVMNPANTLATR